MDLARSAGIGIDPEQELAIDAILSEGEGNRWAALEAALVEPRQNGKTKNIVLPVVLADLFLFGAEYITWTAHLFRTTQKSYLALRDVIERTPHLSRRLKRAPAGNGEEAIELHGKASSSIGPTVEFLARSKTGGRGLTGSRVVLDEAFALEAAHMGSLLPTLATLPNAQVLYATSAGLAASAVMRTIRDRGRAGGDGSLVYVEWCAPAGGCADPLCGHEYGQVQGCALDRVENWLAANEAVARGRISLEFIATMRKTLPPAEFAREFMGWWDRGPEEVGGWALISEAAWSARAGADGRPDPAAFGIAASWPDGEFCGIGSAGRHNGELLVQAVDYRRGTGWVVERCVELRDRHTPCAWVIDPAGPAGHLIPALEAAGLELMKTTAREVTHAAGQMLAGVVGVAADWRHYGQPELTAAVAGAQKRPVGDAWALARRGPADISLFEAVTLAAYGYSVKGSQGAFFASYR